MNKALKMFKLILGWPVSILAVFFIFKVIFEKSELLLPNLKEINFPVLFYGFICYFAFYFIRTIAWQKILKEKGHDLPLREVSFLWAESELKRYVPGNIWSFLGRAFLFSKKGVDGKTIASSILVEIQALIVGSVIVSLLSLSFIIHNFLPQSFQSAFYFYLIIFFSLLITILFVLSKRISKIVEKISFLKHLLSSFTPLVNLNLIFLASLYMFLYGIGTYLVVSSVIFLSPIFITTFIGFFVFSLLVGYLSLITPMGLGVREGLTTIALSKFVIVSSAGFASIFSRIILILSELLFLFFTFIWSRTKNSLFLKFENYVKINKYQILVFIFILIYIIYFTSVSFLRYDNFYTGRFDLGNMDQTVWNTANGRIFQLTDPDGVRNVSRLAFHADFILILLSPFYYIWSHPKMLLIIQTVTLGLGAYFVFKISKLVLKDEKISLVFASTYLINPSLNYLNLFDFHAVALAVTFFLGAFYFFLKKNYIVYSILLVLAALTKEQVWLIIALFGIYIILSNIKHALYSKRHNFINRKTALGIFLFIFSVGIFYLLIWEIMPKVKGGDHFALSYYSQFGTSPSEIIKNLIFSPLDTLLSFINPAKVDYLKQIFSPIGYLSLLSPFYLIFAIPDLSINLLGNNTQLYQIYYQYTSTILPFLFISAIFSARLIQDKTPKIKLTYISIYLTLFSVYAAYTFGPLPGAKKPSLDMITKPYENKVVLEEFLLKIPNTYSVSSTNSIASHLSQREKIFTIPFGINESDIIIFSTNDPFPNPSRMAHFEMISNLKTNPSYKVIFEKKDLIAFQKIN